MRLFGLVLMACLLLPVQAQVYKWTDPRGGVVYGNNPDEHLNAEPVQLGEPSIYSPAEPSVPQVQVRPLYRLNFVTPEEDEQALLPQGELLVEVMLTPAVRGGLRYQYFLDGNLVAEDPAPKIRFQGLVPGNYSLRVRVLDRAQKPVAETAEKRLHLKAGS